MPFDVVNGHKGKPQRTPLLRPYNEDTKDEYGLKEKSKNILKKVEAENLAISKSEADEEALARHHMEVKKDTIDRLWSSDFSKEFIEGLKHKERIARYEERVNKLKADRADLTARYYALDDTPKNANQRKRLIAKLQNLRIQAEEDAQIDRQKYR